MPLSTLDPEMRYAAGVDGGKTKMPIGEPMNVVVLSLRRCARSLLAAAPIKVGSTAAYGANIYSADPLTAPDDD